MIFGITEETLRDKTKVKIINGIAGSGKSTSTVNELNKLGLKYCLASFSNALKFAAADRFGCDTDTICGLAFVNTPYPRTAEKNITEYDTVILDEILLDGIECLNWIRHNAGKVNIICLTDSRQMLQAENSDAVIKSFDRLCKNKYVVNVNLTNTKRARNKETKAFYKTLYDLNSSQLFTLSQAQSIFNCDILGINDIDFSNDNTYICHSNIIEHEVYKRFNLSDNRTNDLIPKNHIARNRSFNPNKYPICDQITATDRKLNAYLQHANVATPTRFQGKEVEQGKDLYFLVNDDSLFTGRELYTVGTRCQDMKSIHIVIANAEKYKDPKQINGVDVVEARCLNIPDAGDEYKRIIGSEMDEIIKQHGEPGVYYRRDIVTSGENIIYSTLPLADLVKFADVTQTEDKKYHAKYVRRSTGARKSIHSITKKDTTMHFDFMQKVYELVNNDVTPPRINNKRTMRKDKFTFLCDIYSAFPTVLHNADMPKAGLIYDEPSDDLLNFYIYEGKAVTTGSLITQELADKLGQSRYVFSTAKQKGCELGHYTYDQCHKSKEKKAQINETFLWGILESDYYRKETVSANGETMTKYVKHSKNNLELVACALWSKLCCVMLDAVSSIKAKDFFVVTDGLYYNGEKYPSLPEWCDYRIENEDLKRILGNTNGEKYDHIEHQSYETLKTNKQLKAEKQRQKRANMSDEERAAARAKNAERMRKARAAKKLDKPAE